MAKLGVINLSWNDQGNITYKYDSGRLNDDEVEEIYALGGAALIDHMLSTLSRKNILGFCVPAIKGLVDQKIVTKPIGTELKKAKLEIHSGNVLYTIFKPEIKMFCNNQKLELSLIQMTLNTVSDLLENISDNNRLHLRFRGYCIIASYEEVARKTHETNTSQSTGRKVAAQSTAHFLSTIQSDLTEEKLENLLKTEAPSLIKRWNEFPLEGDKPLFSF